MTPDLNDIDFIVKELKRFRALEQRIENRRLSAHYASLDYKTAEDMDEYWKYKFLVSELSLILSPPGEETCPN